jgi:hypothetical protein
MNAAKVCLCSEWKRFDASHILSNFGCKNSYFHFIPGLSSVTGLCDGGYFCSNRSISKTPGNLDEGGGPCQPGTYCPLGSPAPIQCPPGEICTAATLTNPDGDCFPGYYCTGGANVATPTGGIVGGRCPLGAYCPKGSRNYTLCPPGTYADTEGECQGY